MKPQARVFENHGADVRQSARPRHSWEVFIAQSGMISKFLTLGPVSISLQTSRTMEGQVQLKVAGAGGPSLARRSGHGSKLRFIRIHSQFESSYSARNERLVAHRLDGVDFARWVDSTRGGSSCLVTRGNMCAVPLEQGQRRCWARGERENGRP